MDPEFDSQSTKLILGYCTKDRMARSLAPRAVGRTLVILAQTEGPVGGESYRPTDDLPKKLVGEVGSPEIDAN